MEASQLTSRANVLIRNVAKGCTQQRGIGSMSTSIYDTAWLAMISKCINDYPEWLFPQSFKYLLRTQLPEGGWPSYAAEIDGILNTMAALLALSSHASATPDEDGAFRSELNVRIQGATRFLQSQLQVWDIPATKHVGFEYLVPTLLGLLEKHGLNFTFPHRSYLMDLNAEKVARFKPELVYGREKFSLLHTLEAFIGRIDFDKVKHQTTCGSMLGSPASTAAYLIHCSVWDDEAENYLWNVISDGEGRGSGAVPSAFPTTIFELTWVMSTLLEHGFSRNSIDPDIAIAMVNFLRRSFEDGEGVVGFAPGLLADVDDTAKTISTLCLLGDPVSPDEMISAFDATSHFSTYMLERNPSISANCNVLKALLHLPNPYIYLSQIRKMVLYLCGSWWQGCTEDKWNLAPQYTLMLLMQALMQLLRLWDQGLLETFPHILIQDRVLVVIFQILSRTLSEQNTDGSWGSGGSCEITAYAVLTLVSVSGFPIFGLLEEQIIPAIEQGRRYLSGSCDFWDYPSYLWIEKVTYSSPVLSQAYCLAALRATSNPHAWAPDTSSLVELSSTSIGAFSQFFLRLPLFASVQESEWKVRASSLEGYLFLPHLKRIRLDIFPRNKMTEDKYLEYIPFTWTASNSLQRLPLDANVLWDMMILSMLNYQADEYMEAVVGKSFQHNLDPIKQIICSLCEEPDSLVANMANGRSPQKENKIVNGESRPNIPSVPSETQAQNESPPETLAEVRNTLGRFIHYILCHPQVKQASPYDQRLLRYELCIFLLAHIKHAEDSTRFSCQPAFKANLPIYGSPDTTYHTWVHSTSADHTSCPYSLAFFACLLGSRAQGTDCFSGVRQKYIAQDLGRRLATMCRQYNDHGSIKRDIMEKNLNSVNFPEFHGPNNIPDEAADNDVNQMIASKKQDLFQLAEYERECMNRAFGKLEDMLPEWKRAALRLFVDVTDLYGQIYVARDIASQMK